MLPQRLTLLLWLLAACPFCEASQDPIGNESAGIVYDSSGVQVPLTKLDENLSYYLQQSIRAELKRRLSPKADVVLADDAEFAHLNQRYSNYKRPTYIAGVKVTEEMDVVKYARARGIPFVARTGGHSLTTSLHSIQDGIVIDMRGLDHITYDPIKQQVIIGGGVQTGTFATATFAHGIELTVGSCPCTGVMGYENTSLFWAVRGAGHNFGIALETTFQVYPQQNDGKRYVVDFEFELDAVEGIFETMNQISSPMPAELAVFIIGRSRGHTGGDKPTINVNLVWPGPKSDAASYVNLFAALSPVWRDEKVATWDALPWATYNGLNNVICTPEGWARFPIKNFYVANVQSYDVPTMRAFVDGWRDMNAKYAGEALFSFMFESFPQQGVRERARDSTAFPWRMESNHFLTMEAAAKSPLNEDIFDRWLSKQQDAWIHTSGFGRLHQYVNYGHGSKDPPESLYGYDAWRLGKLRALKKEYDPEGWFNGY
ncbi:hypothetical protein B0T10DRAFT_528634 [Thelonectria olida]|uniref:FAD-binding PCMH-type domain-containing protein n=1 Tax=Thelonectria olida TaxID=1576542 RepID=A0A9P8WAE9_9HYPO|nr:hypothetical protein B0T10DRAFT_528634 [Thelonectria olida]